MLQSESINFKRILKGLSHTSNFMADTASPSRGLKTWPERPGAGPEKGSGVADWKYVMSLIVFVFLFSFLSSPAAHAEAAITFSLDAQVGTGAIDSQSSDPTAIIYRSGNLTVENAKNYQIKTTSSSTTLSNGSASLTALTGPATLTEMTAGKWGLTILDEAAGSTVVPTASSTYNSPSQTLDKVDISETTSRKLTFGVAAKVNASQASGTYNGATLTISILAEDAAPELPTMQDMTPEFCSTIPTGETVTLEDHRNVGTASSPKCHSYLVSRLADGRCWMVQNLALLGGTKITADDSDISSSAFPSGYTLPASSPSGFGDNTALNVYNGTHQDGKVDTYGYAESSTYVSGSNSYNGTNSGSYYS